MRGIPTSDNFDGVSCTNQKVKLRFSQSNSFGSEAFTVNKVIENYTVEFWFKAD
jgi:hypothetical protein